MCWMSDHFFSEFFSASSAFSAFPSWVAGKAHVRPFWDKTYQYVVNFDGDGRRHVLQACPARTRRSFLPKRTSSKRYSFSVPTEGPVRQTGSQ